MCSSSRSLSISRFPDPSGTHFCRAWQHAFERIKIRGRVFGDSLFDFLRECFGIVHRGLNSRFWPLEVLGHGGDVTFVSTNELHHFPYRKRAALDVGLSACCGVAEINECEFQPSEAFLDQPGAGIARRPPVASRHALQSGAALGGQPHADDYRSGCSHEDPPASIVTLVTIVAPPPQRPYSPVRRPTQ